MPITLNCPKCHKPFRVRDESIGGRVRCPSCGSVLQVPSALSPASSFDEPTTGDTVRPLADAVGPSSHDGGRPAGGLPTVNPNLPGPPSIKMRSNDPPPPPRQERMASNILPVAPTGRAQSLPPVPSSGDDRGWRRVKSGLGMIRMGMMLWALWVLCVFGHAIWAMFDLERVLSESPGMLNRAGLTLSMEVFGLYTLLTVGPALLLLILGRLRCSGAPSEAHAGRLAFGAFFFSMVAVIGLAVHFGIERFDAPARLKIDVPPETSRTALYAAVPSIFLADLMTLLFIGQIGWPLRRPHLQKSVAGLYMYSLLLPAAIMIGMLFYPVIEPLRAEYERSGAPLGAPDSDLPNRVMIWGVIIFASAALLFLRYAAVANAGRRAIRGHLGD